MPYKKFLAQVLLRIRFKKFRRIPISVKLSKDLKLGSNIQMNQCTFGNNAILHDNIVIGFNAKLRNVEIGDNSQIEGGVIITGYGNGRIVIGKECYIGVYNVLDFSDNITIGDYVHIAGPSTGLWTHSSAKQCLKGLQLKDKNPEFRPTAPIVIENNVYIGGNCTIYPGVTIHHHSIVAPNSAVNKDVESYSLVGGVPAKLI